MVNAQHNIAHLPITKTLYAVSHNYYIHLVHFVSVSFPDRPQLLSPEGPRSRILDLPNHSPVLNRWRKKSMTQPEPHLTYQFSLKILDPRHPAPAPDTSLLISRRHPPFVRPQASIIQQ